MCSSNDDLYKGIYRRLRAKNIGCAEEIAQYCRSLVEGVKPKLILLHGSYARGLQGRWSDVDIAVVADFRDSFIDRIGRLISMNNTKAPIEALGYTFEEIWAMLKNGNPFVYEMMECGIPLVGDDVYHELKINFEEAKRRGLTRTKSTWKVPI